MFARKILCLGLGTETGAVEDHLQRTGWLVTRCVEVCAARRQLAMRRFGVAVLVAGTTPTLDAAGVAEVEACVHASSPTEWVALCSPGDLESPAFRALILGCFFDHQVLPLEWHDLDRMLEHAEQRVLLRSQAGTPVPNGDTLGMVGQAEAMVKLRRQIRKVAETGAPVLIPAAIIGAMAYGTYEFTSYAIMKDWHWSMVAADVTWGTTLTALSAWAGVAIARALGQG